MGTEQCSGALRYAILAAEGAEGEQWCIDRLPEKFGYPYLRKKFQDGVELPGQSQRKLNRVVHYSMSCDQASHISSVVDICLGGIRYLRQRRERGAGGRNDCGADHAPAGPDDVAQEEAER